MTADDRKIVEAMVAELTPYLSISATAFEKERRRCLALRSLLAQVDAQRTDATDNVDGCPKIGKVKAQRMLEGRRIEGITGFGSPLPHWSDDDSGMDGRSVLEEQDVLEELFGDPWSFTNRVNIASGDEETW